MTKTDQLAAELYGVIAKSFKGSYGFAIQSKWDEANDRAKMGWRAVARHVMRREARLRKAKR